jgi:P27 family predicted phage terminase small subunit
MAIPGRKPKPNALRVLEGKPGHRPLRPEPKPRPVAPKCPAWLLLEAKREWRRVAPELERLGLLTVVDGTPLAGYCQAYARWRQAETVLEDEGTTFKTPNGYVQVHPQVAIAQKYLQIARGLLRRVRADPFQPGADDAPGGGRWRGRPARLSGRAGGPLRGDAPGPHQREVGGRQVRAGGLAARGPHPPGVRDAARGRPAAVPHRLRRVAAQERQIGDRGGGGAQAAAGGRRGWRGDLRRRGGQGPGRDRLRRGAAHGGAEPRAEQAGQGVSQQGAARPEDGEHLQGALGRRLHQARPECARGDLRRAARAAEPRAVGRADDEYGRADAAAGVRDHDGGLRPQQHLLGAARLRREGLKWGRGRPQLLRVRDRGARGGRLARREGVEGGESRDRERLPQHRGDARPGAAGRAGAGAAEHVPAAVPEPVDAPGDALAGHSGLGRHGGAAQ